nr:hypothetical protein [Tanacetum cinerariifolium]
MSTSWEVSVFKRYQIITEGNEFLPLQSQLEKREDFQEAIKLKSAIGRILEIMSELKNAICEELYHDALKFCKNTRSGLVILLILLHDVAIRNGSNERVYPVVMVPEVYRVVITTGYTSGTITTGYTTGYGPVVMVSEEYPVSLSPQLLPPSPESPAPSPKPPTPSLEPPAKYLRVPPSRGVAGQSDRQSAKNAGAPDNEDQTTYQTAIAEGALMKSKKIKLQLMKSKKMKLKVMKLKKMKQKVMKSKKMDEIKEDKTEGDDIKEVSMKLNVMKSKKMKLKVLKSKKMKLKVLKSKKMKVKVLKSKMMKVRVLKSTISLTTFHLHHLHYAALNGQYDLVRELLMLDGNHLINQTSLRRIRRLEVVWDDEKQFDDVAKNRTALHLAIKGNLHTDLVELFMIVGSLDVNICDNNGMAPLDLLKQRPRSASSKLLIRQLISVGATLGSQDYTARKIIASNLKMGGNGSGISPGTSFKLLDSEMFVYTGMDSTSITSFGTPVFSIHSAELSQINSCLNSNLNVESKSSKKNKQKGIQRFLGWIRFMKGGSEGPVLTRDLDEIPDNGVNLQPFRGGRRRVTRGGFIYDYHRSNNSLFRPLFEKQKLTGNNFMECLILVSLRKEYDSFMQKYNMHSMGKTVTELHAMLKLHEQTLPPREVAPALHAIRAGRIQKNQKKKSHKAAKGIQGKGKAKMGNAVVAAPSYAPKPENP